MFSALPPRRGNRKEKRRLIMSKTQTVIVNGVDTAKLTATIEAIKGDPSLASFQFRLSNQWIGGGENRSRIDDFYGVGQELRHKQPFFLVSDEPEVLLSEDRGPNAGEYVLHALASCLTGALVYHAAARGIRVEELESKLEGDIDLRGFTGVDPNVRKGYQNIRVTFRCKSDASPEQLAELSKFSPVWDTLANPVPVTVRVEKK